MHKSNSSFAFGDVTSKIQIKFISFPIIRITSNSMEKKRFVHLPSSLLHNRVPPQASSPRSSTTTHRAANHDHTTTCLFPSHSYFAGSRDLFVDIVDCWHLSSSISERNALTTIIYRMHNTRVFLSHFVIGSQNGPCQCVIVTTSPSAIPPKTASM